jgi:hypothetical protein
VSDTGKSTLFGELRRMARTSGAVGGIAARVAGERFLGIKTDKAAQKHTAAGHPTATVTTPARAELDGRAS